MISFDTTAYTTLHQLAVEYQLADALGAYEERDRLFREITRRLRPLYVATANKWRIPGLDTDDLIELGYEVTMYALGDFSSDWNSFAALVKRQLMQHLVNEKHIRTAQKRTPPAGSFSLDSPNAAHAKSLANLTHHRHSTVLHNLLLKEAKQLRRIFWQELKSVLSHRQLQVLSLLRQGLTQVEMAARLPTLTAAQIDYAVKQGLARAQAFAQTGIDTELKEALLA